jgi:beta-glucosidase/6-phospho-beta-glucosidase/beta-galactosidase
VKNNKKAKKAIHHSMASSPRLKSYYKKFAKENNVGRTLNMSPAVSKYTNSSKSVDRDEDGSE